MVEFKPGGIYSLLSMIPVVNIFFMALFFPLFTVHATLNFITLFPHSKPLISL